METAVLPEEKCRVGGIIQKWKKRNEYTAS